MRLSKPSKTLLTLILVLMFSLNTANITFATNTKGNTKSNHIAQKIFINGLDMSNLTETEALNMMKTKLEPKLKSSSLTLNYSTTVWKYKYPELGVTYNYKKALESAFKIVRDIPVASPEPTLPPVITTGSAITTDSSIQITTKPAIELKPVNIKLDYVINTKQINTLLDNMSKKIAIKPINAVLKINGRKFEIIPEKNGLDIDKTACLKKITQAITAGAGATAKLAIQVKPVKPKYNKDNLLEVHDKLAEFTTYFNANYLNRVTNIKLAAQNITNLIVMPNEILSADKAMGPRVAELGYLPAHIILGNKMVDGIAGGICQVSTTLYNAALYSNLEIVERSNHSLPSAYVKLGRDATVNGSSKDLKIRNNTGYPIYVVNKIEKGHLTFTIYGKRVYPNRKVVLRTRVLSSTKPTTKYIEDATLAKGKKVEELPSSAAYTVETFRDVYENGKLFSSEKLALDKYRLVNGIVRIGTKQ